MLPLALVVAVIAGDKVSLRAGPERTAAQSAVLFKGDWLEVRGEKKDWLKVYDHRHERPGWVARGVARQIELTEKQAPALRAVAEFLRDAPGSESLGIAYAGLYMKVAAPKDIDAPLLVAVGVMAQRLAVRASTTDANSHASEQLEVAQSWGIAFASVERADGARICYDGAAFRDALALAPEKPDQATAVLGLTDPACERQTATATERQTRDEAALALLDKVDPTQVPGPIGNRVRLRRAVTASRLAWALARHGDAKAGKLAETAVSAFARIDQPELADDDTADWQAAALEVAAARWASAAPPTLGKQDPKLVVTAGEAGETCVAIDKSPTKCTHGQLWAHSLRFAPGKRAAVLAVEPLPGWLELWMFRKGDDGGWMVDVLAPSTDGIDLGYVELAGWSPDGKHAVIVREARDAGTVHKTYEALELGTLAPAKQSQTLRGLGDARAWVTSEWRGRTLALR